MSTPSFLPASSSSAGGSTHPGSGVPAFERSKLAARLQTVLDNFDSGLAANPTLSEQNIQALYLDGPHGSVLSALGWPVDLTRLYQQNVNLTRSLRPDGLLARLDPDGSYQNLIAVDAKKPSELPRFEPGERLNLDKLRLGGSNLHNKIRYCDYGPGAPRWLLLSCADRLYLYDSLNKRWVIALNSRDEMLSEAGQRLLALISWPALTTENATELKNLARRYERKSLEEQLEDEMQGWRTSLAAMLYQRNYRHPALTSLGNFDPLKLQRAVQRVLDRLLLVQILQDKGFVNDLLTNDLDVLQNVLAVRDSFATMAGLALQAPSLYALLNKGVFEQFAGRYGSAIFEPHLGDQLEYGLPGSPEEEVLAKVLKGIMQFSFREFDSRRLGTVYERYAGFRIDFLARPDGSVQVQTRQDMRFRKQSGTYYTPDYIVEYIVKNTLGQALANRTPQEIASLRLLDPACGSGTFLIGAFEVLAEFYQGWYEKWLAEGLQRSPQVSNQAFEWLGQMVQHYPRRILERHLYGVDLNPEAAEFATVSLLLRALEWEKAHDLRPNPGSILPAGMPKLEPLPLILNQNIKVGNSLISGLPRLDEAAKVAASIRPWLPELELILKRRQILCNQPTLDRAGRLRLLDEIAALAEKINYGQVDPTSLGIEAVPPGPARPGLNHSLSHYFASSDPAGGLEGVREKQPFNWPIEFPEVFAGLLALAAAPSTTVAPDEADSEQLPATQDGFDCVIGNPPYNVIEKERLDDYDPYAIVNHYLKDSGIYSHSLGGKLNLSRFFVERCFGLSRQSGLVGQIIPMSIMADQSLAGLRSLVLTSNQLITIVAFPQKDDVNNRVFPEAKLSTSIIICAKHAPINPSKILIYPGKSFTDTPQLSEVNFSEIELIDNENLPIPLVSNNIWNIAVKIHTIAEQRLKDIAYIRRGEINQTIFREFITSNPDCTELLKGVEVGRYEQRTKLSQGFKQWFDEASFLAKGKTKADVVLSARIATQRISGMDDSRRLYAITANPNVYFADSTNSISAKFGYALHYILALFNSRLFEWRFRVTSSNNNVSTHELEQLPIRRIEFTTQSAEREAKLAQIKARYKEESDGLTGLVSFAAEELAAGRADVVHDELAFLAEQMTELTRQRRELVTDFSRYIEQYPSGPTLISWIDALPLNKRKILTGLAQQKQHEVRRLEARPATSATDLNIAAGETALSFWLTARPRGVGQENLPPTEVCRAVFGDERAEFIRYSLNMPRESNFPFNKKQTVWMLATENIRLKDVPSAALSALLVNYRAEIAQAAHLDQLLKTTDTAIDNIVYDLYGLDAAERAIVESR